MLHESGISNILTNYNFVLYYRGSHSQNPSFSLVSIVENNLALFFKKVIVRKFSYIVVEAVQNIERYSAESDASKDFSLIYSDEKMFHVITQNIIENAQINSLKDRLDNVNSKHSEELNEFYMDCLKSNEFTSKGAGLGLIDIARKSKNALSYEFTQLSDKHSTYRLHIRIPFVEENNSVPIDPVGSSLISFLDESFSKNKSTVFYSGDFSNSFLHALLDMLKSAKKEEKLSGNSKFHHILIELTQNIKRHGSLLNNKIPGYLCIEWGDKDVVVSSYNLISAEKESPLREKIESFNRCSDEELKMLSQKFLSDFTVIGGMGLIDVALLSRPNKIVFDLAKNTKLGSYFYVKANINND